MNSELLALIAVGSILVYAWFLGAFFRAVKDVEIVRKNSDKQVKLLELIAKSSGVEEEQIRAITVEPITAQGMIDRQAAIKRAAKDNKL